MLIWNIAYLHKYRRRTVWTSDFIYLGTVVNTENCMKEEMKERIAAGNRAYRVHTKNYFHQN